MKVLVTGGYGFIGSHVAERFHKEGWDVYVIDNMDRGKRSNVSFKHKSYQLSVEDERCEEVFQLNRFDVVVHLAAQISVSRSLNDPIKDTKVNVSGQVNMMSLAHKYKATKFIYASSAAVYGLQSKMPIVEDADCSPISPYGLSKLTGEMYGLNWERYYGLNTIGFRFSNVYGPRQDALGEGGVISIFTDRIISGLPLTVYGDGSQTRDFIYVADVADAIYRAALSDIVGVYNLSTGTECSVNDLIHTLEIIHEPVTVLYEEKKEGDIDRSVLDNTRIKRDLDWSPMYSLQEGLRRTIAAFQSQRTDDEVAAATALQQPSGWKQVRRYMQPAQPYFENFLAFALTAWLTLGQSSSSYGVIDVKIFYIIIVGIMYGNRQSLWAVLLSICLFIYTKLSEGRELISLLYDTDFFFQIAIYLFIGLVVGYTIERKNEQIHAQEQQIQELDGRYDFLNNVYHEVREVKDELQLRIRNAGDSYGKIYSVAKELESLEPEHVFASAVNVVKSIMNVPSVAIYAVNRNQSYMRLLAGTYPERQYAFKSIKTSEFPYLETVLKEGAVYVNKQLSESAPLMCAPICYRNETRVVIMIDGLPFESFSLYHQNLFKITVDLVSSALTKAFTFIEATEHQRYVEGTILMRSEAFKAILATKTHIKDQLDMPYLLLKGLVDPSELKETANRVAALLRETDYIGLDDDGGMLVLLSHASHDDARHVLERLQNSAVPFAVMNEGR